MKCVLVDLDGTLLDKPSTEARFVRHLARRGMIGLQQGLAGAVYFVRWGPRYGRDVARKNKAYLAGLRCARVADIAERFVEDQVLPRLRPFMLSRLRLHAEGGDAVVLLTGAPDFIAAPVARHIHARGCCATRCDRAEDRFTARPPRRHPFGTEKRTLAAKWCAEHGTDLRHCTAYADAGHDEALLAAVGRPIAVTPDRRLAQVARHKGWEIIGGDDAYQGYGQSSLPDWSDP